LGISFNLYQNIAGSIVRRALSKTFYTKNIEQRKEKFRQITDKKIRTFTEQSFISSYNDKRVPLRGGQNLQYKKWVSGKPDAEPEPMSKIKL